MTSIHTVDILILTGYQYFKLLKVLYIKLCFYYWFVHLCCRNLYLDFCSHFLFCCIRISFYLVGWCKISEGVFWKSTKIYFFKDWIFFLQLKAEQIMKLYFLSFFIIDFLGNFNFRHLFALSMKNAFRSWPNSKQCFAF